MPGARAECNVGARAITAQAASVRRAAAADECGAPVVSIPGGEPLLHPQIDQIVDGLVARKKYVYLCTNAIKLVDSLPRLTPSRYLALSIHWVLVRQYYLQLVIQLCYLAKSLLIKELSK